MPLPMPGEYLAYYRKSVGRMGIGRQRTITTSHVASLGGRIASGDEFTDTDSTAYARPGEEPPPRKDFARLLAEMDRRPGTGVAAWHVDRILRNGEDAAIFTRACARGGHLVVTARGGVYDMSEANGRKRLRDDASDAEGEVDHNRERVLVAMAELRGAGRWGGGRRPFGWQLDRTAADKDGEPLKGVLVIDEAEAALIRQAHEDVLGTATLTAIARQWNAAGAAGRQWTQVTVRQVLMRPMNAALMALGGKVVGDGCWPPLVDADAHRAVVARLSDPARRTTPGPERRHLLSGIALCGECGSVLATGSSGTLGQYVCRARKLGVVVTATGTHAGRSVAALDAYARELAIRRLRKPDAALLLRADHTAERTALLAGAAAQDALYDEQWQLYQSRVITPRELAAGRAAISAERERIRGQLAGLDAADAIAPFLADPEAAWDESGILERRALVTGLMYLTVFPSRAGRPTGTRRGESWFDASSVDVRWVRRLPSDG